MHCNHPLKFSQKSSKDIMMLSSAHSSAAVGTSLHVAHSTRSSSKVLRHQIRPSHHHGWMNTFNLTEYSHRRTMYVSCQAEQGGSSGKEKSSKSAGAQLLQNAADAAGVSLGPIGLTISSDLASSSSEDDESFTSQANGESIATMTTEEWRKKYEKDGTVDLWVKEEFNAASRLVGGRAVHFGGEAGQFSGEGRGASDAPRHKVKIFNKFLDQEVDVEVPEDRYILWEAEEQGLLLPYACRMGCCTACAVKVKEGELYQPQGLGISNPLKDKGYALMCIGFPRSDLVLETVEEDEVYEMQFGKYFEERATDPNAESIERDDFAIELALLDE
jgi:ferredoxin